jgi:hypothetical protein
MWNPNLLKYDGGATILSFVFPKNKEYIVTNFLSQSSIFNNAYYSLLLSEMIFPRDISHYNKCSITETFYRYNKKNTQSISGFFSDTVKAGYSGNWSNDQQHQTPTREPYNQFADGIDTIFYLVDKTFYDVHSNTISEDDIKHNSEYNGTGDWKSRTYTWNVDDDTYTAYFIVNFTYHLPFTPHTLNEYAKLVNGSLEEFIYLCVDKKGVRQSTVKIHNGVANLNYHFDAVSMSRTWLWRTNPVDITFTNVPLNIFVAANSIVSVAKENGSWTFTHNVKTKLSDKIEEMAVKHFPINDSSFDDKFHYLFSYIFFGNPPSLSTTNVVQEEAKPKADDVPTPIFDVHDLSVLPIFNHINIACDFRSTQYVFDSHFGTWSSFEDINMIRGIEHQNDFYFAVPNEISYS